MSAARPSDNKSIRIDIGFVHGQVVTVRVGRKQLDALMASLDNPAGRHRIECEDSILTLDPGKVAYVQEAVSGRAVGFADG